MRIWYEHTEKTRDRQSLSYYLCSLSPKSRRLPEGIRGHWLIENSLHWVKDVIYLEDISPQKSGFAPINLSLKINIGSLLILFHFFPVLSLILLVPLSSLSSLVPLVLSISPLSR